jgi:putative spermidine/putrescine transport system permease protein
MFVVRIDNGGARGDVVFIAFYTNRTTNWGQAGALSLILLLATGLLYIAYARLSRATARQA